MPVSLDMVRAHGTVETIADGAVLLRQHLTPAQQHELASECRALLDGPVPAYVPVVRGGGRMHVRMLCLGRHWNGRTYQYEARRSDFDHLPAPPLPPHFAALASAIDRRRYRFCRN